MEEQYNKGMDVRRAVMGDEYVDRSLASITEFNKPMEALTTEWCWGEIWTRQGMDRKTHSVMNLSMLTALNRQAELKAHVCGAINNGMTIEEIRERSSCRPLPTVAYPRPWAASGSRLKY